MSSPAPPSTPTPEHQPSRLRYLFSGAGGAALAVILAAALGPSIAPVSTTTVTVHAPPITQYVSVAPSHRPCSGSKVARSAPYEPNDSISEAYGPLMSGQPINATLGERGEREKEGEDQDFYAFCIAKPTAVMIQLRKTGCESGTEEFTTRCEDLQEELINNQGESIQTATVEATTQATLARKLQPGRYYVRIHEGHGTKYELEITSSGAPLLADIPKSS